MKTSYKRLSIMYLIQFFAWGTIAPVMSLYMKQDLGFDGIQIGIVLSTGSIAVFFSPLVSSIIADRYVSSKTLLILCNIAAGSLLYLLTRQTNFIFFLIIYLFYMILNQPLSGLLNALTFHSLKNAKTDFGKMRVWGTIGWAAAGWLFGIIGLVFGKSPLSLLLIIGVITFFIQSIYSLTLPRPVRVQDPVSFLPKEAISDFFQNPVLIVIFIALVVYIIDTIYYVGISINLNQIGFSENALLPVMSLGQISEIFSMFIVGYLITKFSFRRIFQIGLLMEIIRFGFLIFPDNKLFTISGILFHGPAYAFFFATMFIYIDNRVSITSRSGVHQLITFSTVGFGKLIGNWIAGIVMQFSTQTDKMIDFTEFWAFPLLISIILLSLTFLLRHFGKLFAST